jgi:hypothetical protein
LSFKDSTTEFIKSHQNNKPDMLALQPECHPSLYIYHG